MLCAVRVQVVHQRLLTCGVYVTMQVQKLSTEAELVAELKSLNL